MKWIEITDTKEVYVCDCRDCGKEYKIPISKSTKEDLKKQGYDNIPDLIPRSCRSCMTKKKAI